MSEDVLDDANMLRINFRNRRCRDVPEGMRVELHAEIPRGGDLDVTGKTFRRERLSVVGDPET
ncbi:MAG: hypothetical protein ACRCUE_16790 [Bosea sp. (in: a-proteobacteria)]